MHTGSLRSMGLSLRDSLLVVPGGENRGSSGRADGPCGFQRHAVSPPVRAAIVVFGSIVRVFEPGASDNI